MLTQKRPGAAEIVGNRDLDAEFRIACGHFCEESIPHAAVYRYDATFVLHRVGLGGSKKKES
eukprot:5677636-Pleurochrysis_carterae.AAC.1